MLNLLRSKTPWEFSFSPAKDMSDKFRMFDILDVDMGGWWLSLSLGTCITIYHNACRIGPKHDPVIQCDPIWSNVIQWSRDKYVIVCTYDLQAFWIADSNAFDVKVAAIVGELSADELVTGLMQQWPQSRLTLNPQSSDSFQQDIIWRESHELIDYT